MSYWEKAPGKTQDWLEEVAGVREVAAVAATQISGGR